MVTSIASVADTAEEKFVPYYDLFMPSLKHIVENAVQKELRLLRGKTIECISLIGLAVGKEKVTVTNTLTQTHSVHVIMTLYAPLLTSSAWLSARRR